jgi:thiamine pyrophosphokinase
VQDPYPAPTEPLLSSDRPLVIVGGGRVDRLLLRRLVQRGARVIAADGGADTARDAGVLPDAIVGDMDSLNDIEAWLDRTRVIRIREQQTTDFEKALYVSAAPVTIAVGVTGRRLDHTLAALDALGRYGRRRRIILIDESDLALTLSGSFRFSVDAGERVSIHPLEPVRFARSSGLAWPLENLLLAPGVRTGTSNSAVSGAFSVVPAEGQEGVWLLILDQRYLDPLVDSLMGRR